MIEKNKRKIAKEILYFFFGIFCILVICCFIESKNYFLNNKIESINNNALNLTKQIDSLNTINVLFDKYYSKKLLSNITKMHTEGYSVEDIGNMIDDFSKKFGRKEINLKINKLKLIKSSSLMDCKDYKSKLLNYNEKVKILTYCITIIMGLIYPLRLIYYSLKWSIKTLKNEKSIDL